MLAKSPEFSWPEVDYTPDTREVAWALSQVYERRKPRVIRELNRLKEVGSRYHPGDPEVILGTTNYNLRKKIIPLVKGSVVEFSRTLEPYKTEGNSWESALSYGSNFTLENIKELDEHQFIAFLTIMGIARKLAGTQALDYKNTPLDYVKAAGWAMLSDARNPYSSIADIEFSRPLRMSFRGIKEGTDSPVTEIFVTDFAIKDSSDPIVACVTNSFRTPVNYPIFVHHIEADCSAGVPYVKLPKRELV